MHIAMYINFIQFFGCQSWNLGHVDWVLVPYGNKEINSKKKKLGPQDVVKVVKMDVTRPFCIKCHVCVHQGTFVNMDTKNKFLTFRQQPKMDFNCQSYNNWKISIVIA
jgi:hypothetical protein